MSKKLLDGKVCLVTGAGRGIGKMIAERFAEEGAFVYANGREEGCITNEKVTPIYFDITDSNAVKQAVLHMKKECGRIDVLVNNAGVVTNELLGTVSKEKMRNMFEVNVFGLIELTQIIATRMMVKQKSGSIINVSSIVGVEGSKGQAAYSASKGAVIAFTKSAAKELACHQIRVNSVAPGMTDTERLQVTGKEQYRNLISEVGMGRLATPLDIANACLFFAADLSEYITGQICVVDGGNNTMSRDLYEIRYV